MIKLLSSVWSVFPIGMKKGQINLVTVPKICQ